MKLKIRFITDIVSTVIFILYSIHLFWGIHSNDTMLILWLLILFIISILFTVDAICIKSERFK